MCEPPNIMRTCATEDSFPSEGVAIENMVRNVIDVVGRDNRVSAGCICFLIHCRARCGAANYVTEEPTLDLCDGHGDIEASTLRAEVLDGFTKQGRAPPFGGSLPRAIWSTMGRRVASPQKGCWPRPQSHKMFVTTAPPLKWVHRGSIAHVWIGNMASEDHRATSVQRRPSTPRHTLLQDHIAVLGSKGQSKTWHAAGFWLNKEVDAEPMRQLGVVLRHSPNMRILPRLHLIWPLETDRYGNRLPG